MDNIGSGTEYDFGEDGIDFDEIPITDKFQFYSEDNKKYVSDAKKDIINLFGKGILPPECSKTIRILEDGKMYPLDKFHVFYIKQIEVLLECKYFHWITSYALNELIRDGQLKVQTKKAKYNTIKFLSLPKYRFIMREINRKTKIVDKFSDSGVTKDLGNHLENIVAQILESAGFTKFGRSINEYNGRKWNKTNQNLDFIFQKNAIGIGIEIKNTLDYINKSELENKIEMCEYLDINPFFIVRKMPDNYIHKLKEHNGRVAIISTQVYPDTKDYRQLTREIWEELALPVRCHDYLSLKESTKIPKTLINMAENLVNR